MLKTRGALDWDKKAAVKAWHPDIRAYAQVNTDILMDIKPNLKVVGAINDTDGDMGLAGAVIFIAIAGVVGYFEHAPP